ncbi:hypothetical protein ACX80W_04085 [Arthrobacter sp. TMN-37]
MTRALQALPGTAALGASFAAGFLWLFDGRPSFFTTAHLLSALLCVVLHLPSGSWPGG